MKIHKVIDITIESIRRGTSGYGKIFAIPVSLLECIINIKIHTDEEGKEVLRY